MRYLYFFCFTFLAVHSSNGQVVQLYYNLKLTSQVSANYAYRMAHEQIYKGRVKKIQEDTETIRDEYAKFLLVKEHVHNSLVNINSALIQSKQVIMFGTYIDDIYTNTSDAVSIAASHPELLPFCNKAISHLTGNAVETYSLLHDFVLKADAKLLMDYRERQKIINQLRTRLILLRGLSGNLVLVMKYRSKLSITENMLNTWLPKEKQLIMQIMGSYDRLVM